MHKEKARNLSYCTTIGAGSPIIKKKLGTSRELDPEETFHRSGKSILGRTSQGNITRIWYQ